MDLYAVFKFLHILTAVAWVGGGVTLLVGSVLAQRAEGDAALFRFLDLMNLLGKTWFVPASFLTVVFGAIAATFGGMWGEFWVLLGLAGFASTFFTGLLILEPTGRRLGGLIAEGREAEALAQGRRLMQVGRFDYTVSSSTWCSSPAGPTSSPSRSWPSSSPPAPWSSSASASATLPRPSKAGAGATTAPPPPSAP